VDVLNNTTSMMFGEYARQVAGVIDDLLLRTG